MKKIILILILVLSVASVLYAKSMSLKFSHSMKSVTTTSEPRYILFSTDNVTFGNDKIVF